MLPRHPTAGTGHLYSLHATFRLGPGRDVQHPLALQSSRPSVAPNTLPFTPRLNGRSLGGGGARGGVFRQIGGSAIPRRGKCPRIQILPSPAVPDWSMISSSRSRDLARQPSRGLTSSANQRQGHDGRGPAIEKRPSPTLQRGQLRGAPSELRWVHHGGSVAMAGPINEKRSSKRAGGTDGDKMVPGRCPVDASGKGNEEEEGRTRSQKDDSPNQHWHSHPHRRGFPLPRADAGPPSFSPSLGGFLRSPFSSSQQQSHSAGGSSKAYDTIPWLSPNSRTGIPWT